MASKLSIILISSLIYLINCENVFKLCKKDVFLFENRIYVNSFVNLSNFETVLFEDTNQLFLDEKLIDFEIDNEFKNKIIEYNNLIKPLIKEEVIRRLIKVSGENSELIKAQNKMSSIIFIMNKYRFKVDAKHVPKITRMIEKISQTRTKFSFLNSFLNNELWEKNLSQKQLKEVIQKLNLDSNSKIFIFKELNDHYYKQIMKLDNFKYSNGSNKNGKIKFSIYIPLYDRMYRLGTDPGTDCVSSYPNLPLFYQRKGN